MHRRAVDLFVATGDEGGEGRARNNLGLILEGLGRHAEALAMHDRSVEIKARAGDEPGLARARNNRGNALACLGRHAEALESYRECREIWCKPPPAPSPSIRPLPISWCRSRPPSHAASPARPSLLAT
jgi:tetratricopeptide (TPR) repeat protein